MVCILLFIVVFGVVATVVAGMRANGCSHSVSSWSVSFIQCYLL